MTEKIAPKGQDRPSHSGRCFCFRGASAELPREIASQIPISGLPGTDPVGAMSGSSWSRPKAVLGPSEGPLGGPEAAQNPTEDLPPNRAKRLVPSAQVPSALCPMSVARAPTRPMRNWGMNLPYAFAAKLTLDLPPTLRRAYARRLFVLSSLHAFPLPVNSLKRTFGTTLIYIYITAII